MATVNSITDVDVALRATSGSAADETVEVLGYYAPNDGGGGTFYWEPGVTIGDNGGTIIVDNGNTGRWLRVYDGFVDVKWFGAKGDYISSPSNIGSDDTIPLQDTVDFAVANSINIYLSKGKYRITSTVTVDLTLPRRCNIYGDGMYESEIIHENLGTGIEMIKVMNGNLNTEIRDFSVRGGYPNSGRVSKGLYMQNMAFFTVKNLFVNELESGIFMKDTLIGKFDSVFSAGNINGIKSDTVYSIPANLMEFTNCVVGSNTFLGIYLNNVHSVTLNACDVSGNGTQNDINAGGMYCSFMGANGSNGLNVYNSYFEANFGGTADIKIDNWDGGSTHNFIGNTFNRGATSDHDIPGTTPPQPFPNQFTPNNIFIQCVDTNINPNTKTKVNIIGNGFFYAAWKYTPSASRKNIVVTPNNFHGFDILEQGNIYLSDLERPTFESVVPQISEHTRVKAFVYYSPFAAGTIRNSYNITAVNKLTTGQFEVVFANELEANYVPLATAYLDNEVHNPGTPSFACIAGSALTTKVFVNTYSHAGSSIDVPFTLLIM